MEQFIVKLAIFINDLKNNNIINIKEYTLENIAYTLNSGREHLVYRVAMIISNLSELTIELGKAKYQVTKTTIKSTITEPLVDWHNKEQYYNQLTAWAKLYLDGYDLPWNVLHNNEAQLKLPLPTYVFDGKSYWFEEFEKFKSNNLNNLIKSPVIIINKIKDLCFIINIPKTHIWLSHHIVNGHDMLPGIGHLSLVLQAYQKLNNHDKCTGFSEVVWLKPIINIDNILTIKINFLYFDDQYKFNITDINNNIYSTGILNTNKINYLVKKNNLKQQHNFNHYLNYLNNDALYKQFKASGINYGLYFQAINKLQKINDDSCVAEIIINNNIDHDPLKINLIDAAFQSLLALNIDNKSTLLPFCLDHIILEDLFFKDNTKFIVHTTKSSNFRFQIEVFNTYYEKILTIYDFGVRPMNQEFARNLIYQPSWHKITPDNNDNKFNNKDIIIITTDTNIIKKNTDINYKIFDIQNPKLLDKLESIIKKLELPCELLILDCDNLINQKIFDTDWLYYKITWFLKFLQKIEHWNNIEAIKIIGQNAFSWQEMDPVIQPENTMLIGLAQTAAKEFINWPIYIFSLDQINPQNLQIIINENNIKLSKEPILLVNNMKYTRKLISYELAYDDNKFINQSFIKHGTYLIIGGLGGLGFMLGEHLVRNYSANLIIIGRSDINTQKIKQLQEYGTNIIYEKINLLELTKLKKLFNKHANINGIIHSALALQDKTIKFMEQNTLTQVLDPKVAGVINLIKILSEQNIKLDFILFFSSIQSFIANAGQGNYTAACIFKDTAAKLLANFYMYNVKIINWGYWGNIGIVATDDYKTKMQNLGIGSLEPNEGIKIIEKFLSSNLQQIAVLKASYHALDKLKIKYKNNNDNNEATQLLEQYSRYIANNIVIPDNYLPKYEKLITAIKNIPKAAYVDENQILNIHPWLKSHLHLLNRCRDHYTQILNGNIDYMSVLFPDGLFDLVEPIYKNNPIADYFNNIVAAEIKNYLTSTNSTNNTQTINIIEIGAGTGSTTKTILKQLQSISTKVEYYFTDISYAFLNKAKQIFTNYNNVKYKILNIEQEIPKDMLSFFDILVATNVLHATSDIKNTLSNSKKLLKPNGVIIINEITARQDFATLTFGLTDGWWLYNDFRIPYSPLLSPETWHKFILEIGFKDVKNHGNEQQQVITAINNIITANNNDEVQDLIINTIAEVMHIEKEKIQLDKPFSEYGIDSLIVLELLKPLKEKFGKLPTTIFFEFPTVAKLCNYLYSKQLTYLNYSSNVINPINPNKILKNITIKEDDIAIIGMAGKFPQAFNIEELWSNLAQGLNCITEIPIDRWDNMKYYAANNDFTVGKIYTNFGGFINGIEYFDHEFFNITPYDAQNMDPQERLMLETSYHTIEDAGYNIDDLKGKDIGVFIGVMNGGYGWLGVDNNSSNWADSLYWSIANRISYCFDWHGPSMAIDTACSSSLTAIHQACLALKYNDASLALVGGVNLIIHPKQYTKLCRLHMLSPDNTCKSFGEGANGFVDGEGIVSILLKKHSNAVNDGDRIYAIIKGSSINTGGKTNGYTAPNPIAQANLIKQAIFRAKIKPENIDYIEAHGTGTELGDPVEIRGLDIVFNNNNKKYALGSIKSNIGHLESAAGIAGIIKTILQMKYNLLIPSLHANNENSHLNLTKTPFYIVKNSQQWNNNSNIPRYAIVSSFGAGGANANVVLEEYVYNKKPNYLSLYIIPISAYTLQSLQQQIINLKTWLTANQACDLYSLAYTLCIKKHYKFRVCFIIKNIEELLDFLEQAYVNLLENYITKEKVGFKENLIKLRNKYLQQEHIDWQQIYPTRSVISIPNYSFAQIPHWIENPKHGLSYKQKILMHHKINGLCIVPASFSISSIMNKYPEIEQLNNIYWLKPIKSIDNLVISKNANNIIIYNAQNKNNYLVTAKVLNNKQNKELNILTEKYNDIISKFNYKNSVISYQDIYSIFDQFGYQYGNLFKKLQFAKINNNICFGSIYLANSSNLIDPSILDAGLQLVMLLCIKNNLLTKTHYVPFSIKNLYLINKNVPKLIYCYCKIKHIQNDEIVSDLCFINENYEIILIIEQITSRININNTEKVSNDNNIKIYNLSDN